MESGTRALYGKYLQIGLEFAGGLSDKGVETTPALANPDSAATASAERIIAIVSVSAQRVMKDRLNVKRHHGL